MARGVLPLKRPTPLAYPAGVAPGFNPTHPAARGILQSAIASGGNLLSLLNNVVGTPSGTTPSGLSSYLGPILAFGTSTGTVTLPCAVVSFTGPFTYACIFQLGVAQNLSYLPSTAGFVPKINQFTTSTLTFSGYPGTTVDTGVVIGSDPWIFACNVASSTLTNWALNNLRTGAVYSGTTTTNCLPGSGTTLTASNNASFPSYSPLSVAAVMEAQGAALSLAYLVQWVTTDPWSFWYP